MAQVIKSSSESEKRLQKAQKKISSVDAVGAVILVGVCMEYQSDQKI